MTMVSEIKGCNVELAIKPPDGEDPLAAPVYGFHLRIKCPGTNGWVPSSFEMKGSCAPTTKNLLGKAGPTTDLTRLAAIVHDSAALECRLLSRVNDLEMEVARLKHQLTDQAAPTLIVDASNQPGSAPSDCLENWRR